MDLISYVLIFCLIWASFHFLKSNSPKLPPGPYPLPIIGNILELGQNPHKSLAKLSKIYGPIMHLKFGSINTIVVSSPEIAKEILQKHDYAFPTRITTAATQAHGHHKTSVACLPAGSQWRILRKICKEQMFSTQRLDASRGLRHAKLQKLLKYVQECCVNGKAMDIREAAFVTSLNLISNTLFSLDFAEYNTGSSQELQEIVHGVMRVMGSPNLVDYFPILGWFDPQGIKREAEYYFGKLLAIFDGIINQRQLEMEQNLVSPRKDDLLQALLQISQGSEYELSRNDINHLLLDLFVAGTDTTTITVEWAMTELLSNPHLLSKAKRELLAIIGENKQVEEYDISKLPYLQAIIKETFRYHPPGPYILRCKDGNEELEINNYIIPHNALILVNIWAIGRDPSVWPNQNSFEPERFLSGEIDIKGHNFELIPFGAGRRICPGLSLAYRMVHLMLASLIHNFDWKLESGIKLEEVDMTEKFGLSLQKAVALKAVPLERLIKPVLHIS
ncbi:hypothetical protein BUALT_Bualt08G0046900 [Buddleja alternifolia]|uniref:Cytochrome P450 n=1 Tax=Buddleja alternifolia TaxID=168488 RepID=A0AAV6X7Q7_9LAMI|nr:hypothetical protein BUALT_Bualt08G0046900 [Buddleja alternifolia]